MSSWLAGLSEPVKIPTRSPMIEEKPKKKGVSNSRAVADAIRNGHTSTDEISAVTGLTDKEIWNAIGWMKREGLIAAEPTRYRLTNHNL